MSRAFVKEDGPDLSPLPDLPVSQHPNWVTLRGLTQLQRRLAEVQARLAKLRGRAERLDLMPEAAAGRDIRYYEARLKSAILVDQGARGCDEVAFGHAVRVRDDAGREAIYRIVGEDEAEAEAGLIAPHSPLARALTGGQVGDVVTCQRPAGTLLLEILEVFWP
tara:strand:- start:2578 stop:3069 length:492 start_codon:yes stop_codon:yes gene_type:complete